MWILKSILVVIFSITINCECELEWRTLKRSGQDSIHDIGFVAGESARGGNVYIARSENRYGYAYGRIQIDGRPDYDFSSESDELTTNEEAEFLVDDKSNNYNWVDGSSSRRISNAAIIDESHYIGRMTQYGTTYIGLVPIRSRGLSYSNQYNNQLTTDDYEILVCSQNQQSFRPNRPLGTTRRPLGTTRRPTVPRSCDGEESLRSEIESLNENISELQEELQECERNCRRL